MTKYFALHPATFKLDGGAMFGIIPKPLWEKQIPADELNRIHLSLRVLCIKTDSRVILIDTGIGDYHDAKFNQRFAIVGQPNPLLNILQNELNISPGQVTDVVISHLHFDHVGGLGDQQGQFMFPNARVHVHKSHYAYALQPTARDTGSFQTNYFKPVLEQLENEKRMVWHQGEAGTILKDGNYELKFKVSYGHTPWLMHPFDDKVIYMADLVPTSAHISVPWVMGYDIAPGQTTIDKTNFYHFISHKKLTMIFEHDMRFWGARIDWKNGDVQVIEKFSASDRVIESLPL
jgi:glyoxylase-like metal-dependent hydrolase (beta-lactamase superfamily II)